MEASTAFDKSSENKLCDSSPLEALVRRTSSRRQRGKQRSQGGGPVPASRGPVPPVPPPRLTIDAASPPWSHVDPSLPGSPLLHSHFRSSTASAATNGSVLQYDISQVSGCETDDGSDDGLVCDGQQQKLGHVLFSVDHSSPSAAWPRPTTAPDLHYHNHHPLDHMTALDLAVPTVVVSLPDDDKQSGTNDSPRLNFSRPGRPPILSSEEQKRQVLERNSRRPNSPRTTSPLAHSPVIPVTGTCNRQHLMPIHSNLSRSEVSSLSSSTSGASTLPVSLRPGSVSAIDLGQHTTYLVDKPRPSLSSKDPQLVARTADPPAAELQTPLDYLQLGIQYHQANRLELSATYFEKSAKERGGCGVGMLMWGLALRHGWGCEKNEARGFKWLAKAAESATEDLEKARQGNGMDPNTVKQELVIAIYEVGQCFFQGWGVRKDQKMAVSYYRVAAKLGDMDAQQDLAFCLANGKGCKKNKKEAAKWYREAVAQGASDVGMAWIYKDKYKG